MNGMTVVELEAKIHILEAELEQMKNTAIIKDKLVQSYLLASQAVLSSQSFEEIARKIFDLCIDMIGATSGYIALLSEDGQENEVLFLEAGGRPCTVDPELPMPIRGLRAQSYESMKPVYHNDFMHSEWVKFMPAGHVRMDNVLFAPLNVDGRTVGIMGIANKATDFTPEDSEIAAAFGDLAAVALSRTRDLELMNQLTKDLRRSNEDLEQFAFVASHDLKEPLRTVKSFLGLLEKKYKDELDSQGNEFIRYAVDGSVRMEKMIEGLLNYSKVGAASGKFEVVPMEELLQTVKSNMSWRIESSGVVITQDSLPEVYCDAIQIAELLQNLIGNAIKYSDENEPMIHIGVQEEDNKWVFSVKDNGIGFDSETVGENLFAMFKRVHPEREFSGSGIGLAVCKKIILHHDGEIWAKSEPGKGATFFFTIPKVDQ